MDQAIYLDAIGITQWQLRGQLQFFTLFNQQNKNVGTLILPNLRFDDLMQPEVDNLLDAMLTAIKWHRSEQPTIADPRHFFQDKQVQKLLIMGWQAAKALWPNSDSLAQLSANLPIHYQDIPAIVTFHPMDLIQQPNHKRAAWNHLKMLCNTPN